MRTLKRTLLWALLLFLLETLLIACNCPEPGSLRYANEQLTAINLDNAAVAPRVSDSDSVNKNAYGIRINIERTLVAATQGHWDFGNSAYANRRECFAAEYHPASAIETIRIITLHDFDATHQAGADLSAYFKQVKSGKFSELESLYDVAAQVFYGNILMPLEADVLLIKAPEYTGIHAFVVEAYLQDGTVMKDTTTVQLY